MEKYESFVRWLSVLEQAERNLATQNKIYYMEVITQFNLIFELAWKALKEMLDLYGVTEVATGHLVRFLRQHINWAGLKMKKLVGYV